tara:strand:- start:57 stop:224 length:168 start_codon:yes stop_codon:yes gene_type:complete
VSEIIKRIKPDAVIKGNTAPPRNGSFEVTIDERLVFSKLQTGKFPDEDTVSGWFE